jgi:hypothetical protein
MHVHAAAIARSSILQIIGHTRILQDGWWLTNVR